jgi:hypothetical protein
MQAWDEWLTDIDQVKRLSAEMHSAATTLEASAAVYALVDTETSEFEYASKILTAKAWRQEAAYFGIH